MRSIDTLLSGNKEFQSNCNKSEMEKLSTGQSPRVLWIGCSDSRVCPSIVSNLGLGEIFVHRNIANQVSEKDINGLAVIEYAVNFLKVDSIVVCGHSGCGGVNAALEGLPATEYIGDWISDLKNLAFKSKEENPDLSSEELEKINVVHQIDQLKNLSVVKNAVQNLNLYGCLFDIKSGKLSVVTEYGGDNE